MSTSPKAGRFGVLDEDRGYVIASGYEGSQH